MREDRFLFYNDGNGKWEFYDSTYDITIHCKTQQEQDRAVELLHKAQNIAKEEVMQPENAARTLKRLCNEHPADCRGCPFEARGSGKPCKLMDIPSEWDV